MAPFPSVQDGFTWPAIGVRLAPFRAKRMVSDSTLISVIIPLVILSILTTAITSFFIRRTWTRRQEARRQRDAEAPTPPPLAEHRPSNWARQGSNVLWSGYINDDDLRAQFSRPSKDSRMFSIGSMSTVGPLDIPSINTGRPGVTVEHDEKPQALNMMEEIDLNRAEKGARPTIRRATCTDAQNQENKGSAWSGVGRRKASLTTA